MSTAYCAHVFTPLTMKLVAPCTENSFKSIILNMLAMFISRVRADFTLTHENIVYLQFHKIIMMIKFTSKINAVSTYKQIKLLNTTVSTLFLI